VSVADVINQRVVENARVAYKKNWNPEPILHAICAFANDSDHWGGGYLIIGVEEARGMPRFSVTGVDSPSIRRSFRENEADRRCRCHRGEGASSRLSG
jgi:ATP-dependent DNA helicase RecG